MSSQQKKNQKPQSKKKEYLNQYLKYSTIGFQMIAIIAGGALLGDWLDSKYQENGRLYTIVCSLLSIFLALYLALKELLKKPNEKED